MTREQREEAINWLSRNRSMTNADVRAKFKVSSATANRYLRLAHERHKELKERGRLERMAALGTVALKQGLVKTDGPVAPTPEPVAPAVSTAPSVLTDVAAILEERGKRYGDFMAHARITQRLKAVAHAFAAEQGKTFDADQAEAIDMIFHKLGRILNGDPNYADSWVDIAGYAKLVADRLEETAMKLRTHAEVG